MLSLSLDFTVTWSRSVSGATIAGKLDWEQNFDSSNKAEKIAFFWGDQKPLHTHTHTHRKLTLCQGICELCLWQVVCETNASPKSPSPLFHHPNKH